MWNARNRHVAHQFFNADNGTPGGGGNPPEPSPAPKDEKIAFTPEQQQYLNNLLAAERKDTEEKTALKLKSEADAKAQAEQEARERDEAAKRGEFDAVRADLETKVATIDGERTALATERDALRTYFDAEYTAAIKDMPDVIAAFKPADDASFAERSAWLVKAKEQAAKVAADTSASGNRPNPKAADGKFDLDAAIARARATGRYRA